LIVDSVRERPTEELLKPPPQKIRWRILIEKVVSGGIAALVTARFMDLRFGDGSTCWFIYMLCWAVLFYFVSLRLGLLSTAAMVFVIHVLVYTPVTSDPERWYFAPQSLFGLGVIATLATFALTITCFGDSIPRFPRRRKRRPAREPSSPEG
jgi:hypothetical protein